MAGKRGRGRSALLVAATGGHLEQLMRLHTVLRPWFTRLQVVTFDTEQSRSLLRGLDRIFVPPVPPRGLVPAVRTLPRAVQILRAGEFTDVISTGAAIAVPFFLAGRSRGMRCHYIESAARTEGPSLTGKILSRVPGVHLSTQHEVWAGTRWTHAGSVFDGYSATPRTGTPGKELTAVVTTGSLRGFPFQRAVDRSAAVLRALGVSQDRVFWQVGDAQSPGSAGEAWVPAHVLREAIRRADVVISHSGVGSCLQILEAGKVPVLLPRRAAHREQVDDHQQMIADLLESRDLAVAVDPDELSVGHLREAMSRAVTRSDHAPSKLLAALELTQRIDAS